MSYDTGEQTGRRASVPAPGGWRILYTDGAAYTSADGNWSDAPTKGVVAVVAYVGGQYQTPEGVRDYREVLHSQDLYWQNADGTLGSGLARHAPDTLPAGAIKEGRLIEDAAWRRLLAAAFEAHEAP